MKCLEKCTGQGLAPPLRPPGGKASSGLCMAMESLGWKWKDGNLPSLLPALRLNISLSLLAGASMCK